MRRSEITTALLLFGGLLSASCTGGGEEMGEAQPSEMDVAAESGLDCYIARGTFEETQDRPSPLRTTRFSFHGGEGLLCYGAPSARGRAVMGSLVPYGQPWRIGANEPTTIHLSASASVGGVPLDPGSYSLYAIPGEQEWEFLINANWQRWGIPIDPAVRASEIGSFVATPEAMVEPVETLAYSWEADSGDDMGNLVLEWENTRIRLPVQPSSD